MKARINGWRVEIDVVRCLGKDPHTVDVTVNASSKYGSRITGNVEIRASEAADLAASLDALGHLLERASEADECARCGRPCDPGETYCPTCEEAQR